jgi:SAM-dependent methyltransferase
MSARVHCENCDASKKLPFDDSTFDAVFSNDVLCHLPGRPAVLGELFRVLRRGGRILFSDALIIGGMISHQEIATRSSIGYYIFSLPGENERMLKQEGFLLVSVADTTENAALVAKRWRDARQKRKEALTAIEGEVNFEGLQEFLSSVHALASERRLLRHLYVAEKPGERVTSI